MTQDKNSKTPITELVTHSGSFHADDVMAFVVLSELYPEARLVRTRAPDLIAAAPNRIVFDIGRTYDPQNGQFDHHQPDKLLRECGLPYSAFGLIWKHFGHGYLIQLGLDYSHVNSVLEKIEQDLVRMVDRIDNGIIQGDSDPAMHSSSIIPAMMLFRPDFDDETGDAMDNGFRLAASVAREIINAMIRTADTRLRAAEEVNTAIYTRLNNNAIILHRGAPWLETVLESEAPIHFVVCPGKDEWQINVVNQSLTSFEARKSLPESWAGKSGEDLAVETGVSDAYFCHTGRFIACTRSLEGAMALLNIAQKA
jgi:uncharacterized UPF0160 family protein